MVRARVLVTDAETPAALAVARSLSAAGHRVHVLTHDAHAAAAASHCTVAIRTPNPLREPLYWMESLVEIVSRRGFDVLLPVSDTALRLADFVRGRIPPRTALAMPSGEVIERSQDKPLVLARAEALGIPVLPRRSGPEALTAELPAVVKPNRSRVVTLDRVKAATAVVVTDRSALAAAISERTDAGLGAYVEPWIPGEGRGVFLLLDEGRVLAHFAHLRLREASPLGGPSAVAEAVPQDRRLFDYSVALARDLGVTGPFMAEFRVSGDDVVLLEVNARYWGSLALAIAAGIDFPALHIDAILGRPRIGPEEYRTGLRTRNLAFDLRWAAGVLRGAPAGSPVAYPGRLRALMGLLTSRAKGMIWEPGDGAAGRAHMLSLMNKAVNRE